MSKKVYLRRKDLGGHLPKAVRAEARTRLSSVYVNRQPLKGFSRQVGPIRFGLGLGGGSVYSVELLDAFPVGTSAIELNNELDGLVQLTVTFAYTNWKRASNTQGFINMDIDTPLGGIDVL